MRQSIREDAFATGLRERLPRDVWASFSDEQLAALKVAMGARQWGKHPVDLRGTLKLGYWRYYVVLVAGRNRRELSRRERHLSQAMTALGIVAFLGFCALLGLLVLYLGKSALGINLLPDFSFGVWDWFRKG